eukprot:TRINITY_DN34315_c0_g1_i3.p2 TRINITY_DN34315_c0_g1~~TRINITY_DN34315_c0_g1_i3.p2  ORF type:complete len:138 (-),score=13.08 TRINITY_DN34315_c0_g1_i3:110-523(-)
MDNRFLSEAQVYTFLFNLILSIKSNQNNDPFWQLFHRHGATPRTTPYLSQTEPLCHRHSSVPRTTKLSMPSLSQTQLCASYNKTVYALSVTDTAQYLVQQNCLCPLCHRHSSIPHTSKLSVPSLSQTQLNISYNKTV